MTKISTFLQECRDIEAKATKKAWRVECGNNWKRLVYRPMDEWGIHEQAETLIGRWDSLNGIQEFNNQDAEFIAFSRNNFLKLVQVVEILSGACGGAQEQVNRRLLDEEDGDLIAAHLTLGSALAKCEKILK